MTKSKCDHWRDEIYLTRDRHCARCGELMQIFLWKDPVGPDSICDSNVCKKQAVWWAYLDGLKFCLKHAKQWIKCTQGYKKNLFS